METKRHYRGFFSAWGLGSCRLLRSRPQPQTGCHIFGLRKHSQASVQLWHITSLSSIMIPVAWISQCLLDPGLVNCSERHWALPEVQAAEAETASPSSSANTAYHDCEQHHASRCMDLCSMQDSKAAQHKNSLIPRCRLQRLRQRHQPPVQISTMSCYTHCTSCLQAA